MDKTTAPQLILSTASRPTRLKNDVQLPWLEAFLDDYKNHHTAISYSIRIARDLRCLHRKYGINLQTVDWLTLHKHLEFYRQEYTRNTFLRHRSIILRGLSFLGRRDLVKSAEPRALSGGKIHPVPEWAKDWFNGKLSASLSKCTLENYVWTLEVLNIDLSKSTIAEIRSRLAEYSTRYSRGSLRLLTITAKQILKELNREKDAENLKLPKASEPRIVVYSQQEIDRMLKACQSLRDRLLIGILTETGARRGELYNMRIKDVQFDEYSAIVWLHGKTGTRQRRIFRSQADLLEYVKLHPNRSDPEARFWVDKVGRGLSIYWVYKTVTIIGQRALQRHIYPHGLRHSAATKDVSTYTDREMMIRYGWSRPDMVGVYAHLTGRDVDEKELQLRGLKNGRTYYCGSCNQENPSMAAYCMKCGQILLRANGGEQLG